MELLKTILVLSSSRIFKGRVTMASLVLRSRRIFRARVIMASLLLKLIEYLEQGL